MVYKCHLFEIKYTLSILDCFSGRIQWISKNRKEKDKARKKIVTKLQQIKDDFCYKISTNCGRHAYNKWLVGDIYFITDKLLYSMFISVKIILSDKMIKAIQLVSEYNIEVSQIWVFEFIEWKCDVESDFWRPVTMLCTSLRNPKPNWCRNEKVSKSKESLLKITQNNWQIKAPPSHQLAPRSQVFWVLL